MPYLPPREWYATLPTVHVSAGALLTDDRDRVLLVKPDYRPDLRCAGAAPSTGHGTPPREEPIMDNERFEVQRTIAAPPARVFSVLTDPRGHVAIDSSGMLQSAEGDRVRKAGDEFVVHMDRESLNDYPLGKYDVTVVITEFAQDAHIEWTIRGAIKPHIQHLYGYRLEPAEDGGTLVTTYYDWSQIDQEWRDKNILPVIPESGLRATLGILARTVEQPPLTLD